MQFEKGSKTELKRTNVHLHRDYG